MKNNDKLSEILKFLSVNTLNFSREIGVTPQQIYDIKSGKIKSITANLAAKIVSRYPEISLNWLLTGEGDMLAGNKGSRNVIGSHNSAGGDIVAGVKAVLPSDLIEVVKRQQETIALQQETIARQQEQTSRLLAIIEGKL